LLAPLQLRGGDRKSNSHDESLILADLGIDRNQSSRWQQIAGLADDDFEDYVRETRAAKQGLTTNGRGAQTDVA